MAGPGPLEWPPRELPRVAPRPSWVERLPSRPLAFGAVLFVAGWLGIVFQQSVLRQLVVGAPVFEEMAKFGLALVVVALLRLRAMALRLPVAWASGAAFGVLEHYLTYSGEPALFWALRVAFHLATAGLSMAIYGLVEVLPDARVRWTTTLTSSLFHAANNIGALVFGLAAAFADTDPAATLYSGLIVLAALALTLAVLAAPEAWRERAQRVLARIFGPPRPAAPPTPPDPPGP